MKRPVKEMTAQELRDELTEATKRLVAGLTTYEETDRIQEVRWALSNMETLQSDLTYHL